MTAATTTERPFSLPLSIAPLLVVLGLVFALAFVGIDSNTSPLDVVTALGVILPRAAWPAVAILASAAGLGVLARPILRGTAREVEAIVGLSVFLTLCHALGWLGLSAGPQRQLVVLLLVGVGLCVFVADRVRTLKRPVSDTGPAVNSGPGLPRWVSLAFQASFLLAAAVLIVAALSPPGWLWSSEFGGFDAISYHLELPQEWLRNGALTPLEHNVYSFQPGYMESAYLAIAGLMGAPSAPTASSNAFGLAAGLAQGAIACQLFHAGIAIWSARALAALARRVAPAGSAAVAPLLLSIPWVIVVGSLAYNEMPMLLLMIGAISCAADNADGSLKRTAIAAWLAGIAVCVKLTAVLLVVPSIGIALLVFTPWKRWPAMALTAVLVGAVSLLPWLARNFNAGGNPVFPMLADYFTPGHWNHEQPERFARSHQFDGSLVDRLRLVFLPDAADPAGARHRGVLHPQWAMLFPVTFAACAALAVRLRQASPALRRWTIVVIASLCAQLAAWLFATHIQSRFLLPMAPIAVLAIALMIESFASRASERGPTRTPLALAALVAIAHCGWATYLFTQERNAHPNTALVVGAGAFTGEAVRAQLPNLPAAQRDEVLNQLPPEAYVNLTLPHDTRVWLLGDATPFYLGCDVIYNTTYDTSPLSAANDRYFNDPTGWVRYLKAQKIEYVLVNFAELDRYQRSGMGEASMTAENARKLIVAWGTIMHAWPEQGRALYRLRTPPPPLPPTAEPSAPDTQGGPS